MPELQDIFIEHGDEYQLNHKFLSNQLKAFNTIKNCRTSILGAHIDKCNECGFLQISYNSCRNRHCPKCQTLVKERWIYERKKDLLNIGYFHIVFTIPDIINPIAYQNQKTIYNILFKAAAETLSELSSNKKYLGGQIGFTQVLHTWGQNLMYHPHTHCIVTGGGLNLFNNWVNSRKKFFIPVRVLSKKFRGKFLYYLKQAELKFYNSYSYLEDNSKFNNFISLLYKKEWVVYCKAPFKNVNSVVEYLGRYTHRVAISNNRILSCKNGIVSFKWRDYRDSNKQKIMKLKADEFIRRFLIHILPNKFTKIRHYGLLSPRNKSQKLALCKKLTNTIEHDIPKVKISAFDLLKKLTGKDFTICPCCGIGHLSRASPCNMAIV